MKIFLRSFGRIVTVLFFVTSTLAISSVAHSAPPESDYPSAEVKPGHFAYVSGYGDLPLRRGFYDHEGVNPDSKVPPEDQGGTGFGLDKAQHKHNFVNVQGIIRVIEQGARTNRGPERPTVLNFALTTRTQACVPSYLPGNTICTNEAYGPFTLIAAVETDYYDYYHGMPAGGPDGQVGLLTAYCKGYNPTCPDEANGNTFVSVAEIA